MYPIFPRFSYTVTGFANNTLNVYMYFVDTTAYPTAPMFLWQGWRHDCGRGGDTTGMLRKRRGAEGSARGVLRCVCGGV